MSEQNGKGALSEWKTLATFEATLPSGVRVKARYLDMERVLMSGEVNVAVLEGLDKPRAKATGAKRTSQDSAQIAEGLRYKQHVVTSSIVEVSGEPVQLAAADFFDLPEADRDILFRYIQRIEPVPLAKG